MRIDITGDAARFLAEAENFLRRDPLRHTVIATAVANELGGRAGGAMTRFLTVRDDAGQVVGVATSAFGGRVYLGELPSHSISAVADAFSAEQAPPTSVEGVQADAAAFARYWSQVTGGACAESYSARLFRLGTLSVPEAVGKPRPATEDDLGVCRAFVEAFCAEIGEPRPFDEDAALRRIDAGFWWLWEQDGAPAAFVARNTEILGWARIGPVYTPPQLRGNGFASALTAAVSGVVLAEGAGVCLFTDLANPTSNKIYQAIGYEPVRDFVHYTLTAPG
ncbi:GNAT family N-acetyltransferase [Nocardia rhizosphaerihabitans]|uniref:GNAT family N-acetyltransferase n=1 Tax=Nocardia rhizosphaerihabitans TaxID=1691570 RepID=UPI00367295F0